MALLSTAALTLSDHAKRLDPDGKIAVIIEMLAQTNEVLLDQRWIEGNLPTGHRTTIRTGLPSVYWRLLNQGVPTSKSDTAQVTENAGMLEAWSEVDKDLALLNGNVAQLRLSESRAFIEAMNIEMASTLFYGNAGLSPEEFTGLAPRYSLTTAGNGQNIILGGGAGADNSSIWLVVWGDQTVHGIFPKGSQAGLIHDDFGEVTVEDTAGLGGSRLRALQERYQWKAGLVVKDWRYAVRVPNIDISDLVANAGSEANMFDLMARMTHRIPSLGMGTPAFYMNRTLMQMLDIQAMGKLTSGGGVTYENVDGRRVAKFRGIPIRTCDALLETEALVA